jgi:hypothetical protein
MLAPCSRRQVQPGVGLGVGLNKKSGSGLERRLLLFAGSARAWRARGVGLGPDLLANVPIARHFREEAVPPAPLFLGSHPVVPKYQS